MGSELDRAISGFFDAIYSPMRSMPHELFEEEAVVTDDNMRFVGLNELNVWGRLHSGGQGERLHALASRCVGNETCVETITCHFTEAKALRITNARWRFLINKDKISSLSVVTESSSTLSPAIASFIEGVNLGDTKVIAGAFSQDARVNDQLSEYVGLDAIREWIARDIVAISLRVKVLGVQGHYHCIILSCEIDGNFDRRGLPEPLIQKFYVLEFEGRIALLIVLPDEQY